ncbi:hypothetical protein NITGR_730018 [Nitrospina gracilis 3/211]|uniref:Uncharacterized protein n=2 Tax=Nitrospinaceae TaxID=407032 RepID=M1ZDK4_NITG3|nr:hypothetical protein NITGR_730018 [Nitrospina gracilis 3/211]
MNIWEFEYFQGQPLISFMNFSHKWDGKYFEGSKERWIWPAHVEKTIFGKIRLPLDDDLGFYFEKLEEERNVISE